MNGKTSDHYWGKLKGPFGYKLLGLATSVSNIEAHTSRQELIKEPYCRTQFVKYLINKGVAPSNTIEQKFKSSPIKMKLKEGHLAGAINSFCPGSIELLSKNMHPDQVAQSSMVFNMRKYETDKYILQKVENIGLTFKTLKKINDQFCTKTRNNCEASLHLKNEMKGTRQRSERDTFLASKAGKAHTLKNKICSELRSVQLNKQKIAEERDKGKVSGFVNASKLKKWGDAAFAATQSVKHKSKLFRSLAQQNFDLKMCN